MKHLIFKNLIQALDTRSERMMIHDFALFLKEKLPQEKTVDLLISALITGVSKTMF